MVQLLLLSLCLRTFGLAFHSFISALSAMKYTYSYYYRFTLGFISLLMLGFSAFAQEETIKSTEVALRSGSSKELVKYFNEGIEISVNNQRGNYSTTQAEFIIKDFFKKHPPAKFEYLHKGASKEGLRYAMGRYTATDSRVFRIYLVVKQAQGKFLIDTLNISADDSN